MGGSPRTRIRGDRFSLSEAASRPAVAKPIAAWGDSSGSDRSGRLEPQTCTEYFASDSEEDEEPDHQHQQVPDLFPLGKIVVDPAEYPATMLQEAAYAFPGSKSRLNLVVPFSLDGVVDPDLVEMAARRVVLDNDGLRVTIAASAAGPSSVPSGALLAVVAPKVGRLVAVIPNGPIGDDSAMTAILEEHQTHAFTPGECPVRIVLVGHAGHYHTMSVVCARYACDLVGVHTFVRSLCDTYSGRVGGGGDDDGGSSGSGKCTLAQLGTWEAKLWRSDPAMLEQASAFWTSCCRSSASGAILNKLHLPATEGSITTDATVPEWLFLPVELDADITTSFKDFLILPDGADDIDGDDHGLLLCLTSFAVLMKHAARRDDYVMGSSVSVRDLSPEATAGLIAPLTNDVPLQVITSNTSSFIDIFIALGRTLNKVRRRSMCAVRLFKSLHGLDTFPVKFEFIKSQEVAELSSELYSAGFLGSDNVGGQDEVPLGSMGSRCKLRYRAPPSEALFPKETSLVFRAWESPDPDNERIFAGLWFRSAMFSQAYIESLLAKFSLIVEEASNEPHITLVKLAAELNGRSSGNGNHDDI